MISSRYLHVLRRGGRGRVLNLMTGDVLDVPAGLMRAVRGGRGAFRLRALRPAEREELRRRDVLFDDAAAERRALERHLRRQLRPGKRLNLNLTLTYFCNLRCRYCAQKRLLDVREFMDEATARRVVRWTGRALDRLGSRLLKVTFYGGEPLLARRVLLRLASGLRALCARRGVRYRYDMFTNGTLLSERAVADLDAAGVRTLVVTLDGARAVHDARRPFKSGRGSHDLVVAGLRRAVARGFDVTVATNLDAQRPAEIESFLRGLRSRGIAGRVRFAFGRTMLSGDNADYFGRSGMSSDRDFLRRWTAAMAVLRRLGLDSTGNPARLLNYGVCDFWDPASYIVMPDGSVTKCLANLRRPEQVLGHVARGRPRATYDRRLAARAPLELFAPRCRRCRFLPHCFGGCVAEARVLGRYPGRPYCQRPLVRRGLDWMLARGEGIERPVET